MTGVLLAEKKMVFLVLKFHDMSLFDFQELQLKKRDQLSIYNFEHIFLVTIFKKYVLFFSVTKQFLILNFID